MIDEVSPQVEYSVYASIQIEQRLIYSEFLERAVVIDIYLPLQNHQPDGYNLLLINDGQDLRTMDFGAIVDPLIFFNRIEPLMCVGIHCGLDRMNEYGTVYRTDYKGRGAKAGLYSKFILDELLPFLKKECSILSFREKAFAGFSLGGLSALDLVWNHPQDFVIAGVFSGSLWWRRRGYEDENYNDDTDRIMHLQVQKGTSSKKLKFFFECGCLDETADRNNNGIIDSIEDTTDLIKDLKARGYGEDQIRYLELKEGKHDVHTWAAAFPEFLKWGWGKNHFKH
jgi:enterochelin esterase-like enzyme